MPRLTVTVAESLPPKNTPVPFIATGRSPVAIAWASSSGGRLAQPAPARESERERGGRAGGFQGKEIFSIIDGLYPAISNRCQSAAGLRPGEKRKVA